MRFGLCLFLAAKSKFARPKSSKTQPAPVAAFAVGSPERRSRRPEHCVTRTIGMAPPSKSKRNGPPFLAERGARMLSKEAGRWVGRRGGCSRAASIWRWRKNTRQKRTQHKARSVASEGGVAARRAMLRRGWTRERQSPWSKGDEKYRNVIPEGLDVLEFGGEVSA